MFSGSRCATGRAPHQQTPSRCRFTKEKKKARERRPLASAVFARRRRMLTQGSLEDARKRRLIREGGRLEYGRDPGKENRPMSNEPNAPNMRLPLILSVTGLASTPWPPSPFSSWGLALRSRIVRVVGGLAPFSQMTSPAHSAVNWIKCRRGRIRGRTCVAIFGERRPATNRDMSLSSTLAFFLRFIFRVAWLLPRTRDIELTSVPRQDGSLKARRCPMDGGGRRLFLIPPWLSVT